MQYHYFYFTKYNTLKDYHEDGIFISLDLFLKTITKHKYFELWHVNKFYEYEKINLVQIDNNWRCVMFYLLKKGEDKPSGYTTSIEYNLKNNENIVSICGKLNVNELKCLLNFSNELGINLLYEQKDLVITENFIKRLESKGKNSYKPTVSEERVLSEVDSDAAWIFIPNIDAQKIIKMFGSKSKESNIVKGLYTAFEKNYVGIAGYNEQTLIFGKNISSIMQLPFMVSNVESDMDSISALVKYLSIQFGEAQYYCYNKFESSHILYKSGKLVYSGLSGDGVEEHQHVDNIEQLELSPFKIKEIAENNGMSLEDLLIGCMSKKVRCQLIEVTSSTENFFNSIINQVLKKNRSK